MGLLMRTFIGIPIPVDLRERIVEIQHLLKGNVKFVEPENLHVTVKFLGEIDENSVENVISNVHVALERFKRFRITLENLGCFPDLKRIRVIWIGVKENKEKLVNLIKEINSVLSGIGFCREKRIEPHVTIGRVKRRDERVVNSVKKIGDVNIGEMFVEKVVLYKSELMPNGPVYTELHRWNI
ncbi:MAG: RNA 2',3'-cyclic phosphodiesterase [Candidatus Aenigmatarchaeota archaeon]|nr:MAG: RNA 2',3'-cyclic phosphodiesterase [Candidatus Aenigmarchaeota archaeon]